jgi:hypothetical protein
MATFFARTHNNLFTRHTTNPTWYDIRRTDSHHEEERNTATHQDQEDRETMAKMVNTPHLAPPTKLHAGI